MFRAKCAFLTLCITAGLATVWYGGGVQAQDGFKIGVVNLKVCFDDYQRQKDEFDALTLEMTTLQTDLDVRLEAMNALRTQYDENRDTMSREELAELEEKIESERSSYNADFQKVQTDLARREDRVAESVYEDIRAAIEAVGNQQNYHLVLESGKNTNNGLLHYSPTLDITQRVVDYLNANYTKI